MAIYHLSARDPITRSSGKSATAAAAYRACMHITDERTGEVFDYSKKRGLRFATLMMPGGQSVERDEFWNLVELHHKRGDAQVARELIAALPFELNDEQRAALAIEFSAEVSWRYQVAIDLCLHAPGWGDDRNEHAHILMSACSVANDGKLGKKVQELDPIWCKRNEHPTLVDWARSRWEELCNSALERAGHSTRIDHRSHEARGLSNLPTVKQGNGPKRQQRMAKNAEIRHINATLPTLKKARAKARAAELASRFIKPIPTTRKEDPMAPELHQKITARIDALLAQQGTTLDTLRVQLRPLGVTMLEDRHDDFYWKVNNQYLPEIELGQQYTKPALLNRGLLLEEPKKPLGFATQVEAHKPDQQADDDLAIALRTLLDLSRLLSAGAQNLLIHFLNFVLNLLGIDYQIQLRQAEISQHPHARILGTGMGTPESKKNALEGVVELTKKVELVVKPDLYKARLERATQELELVRAEEQDALAILFNTSGTSRAEPERVHKELMARRARLQGEVAELQLCELTKDDREQALNEHLVELREGLIDGIQDQHGHKHK